jgi:hypothetical protein
MIIVVFVEKPMDIDAQGEVSVLEYIWQKLELLKRNPG